MNDYQLGPALKKNPYRERECVCTLYSVDSVLMLAGQSIVLHMFIVVLKGTNMIRVKSFCVANIVASFAIASKLYIM